jgi:hypothetical protein
MVDHDTCDRRVTGARLDLRETLIGRDMAVKIKTLLFSAGVVTRAVQRNA